MRRTITSITAADAELAAERDVLREQMARIEALADQWVKDRAGYPLDDSNASVAFIVVKQCEEELRAAIAGGGS